MKWFAAFLCAACLGVTAAFAAYQLPAAAFFAAFSVMSGAVAAMMD